MWNQNKGEGEKREEWTRINKRTQQTTTITKQSPPIAHSILKKSLSKQPRVPLPKIKTNFFSKEISLSDTPLRHLSLLSVDDHEHLKNKSIYQLLPIDDYSNFIQLLGEYLNINYLLIIEYVILENPIRYCQLVTLDDLPIKCQIRILNSSLYCNLFFSFPLLLLFLLFFY